MTVLTILSALRRFFYACFSLILDNKRWSLIIILLICLFMQSCQVNRLASEIKTLKQQHKDYVTQQQLATEKAKVQAAEQEKKWAKQLTTAEQNYNAKLKQINADASAAQSAANSLSKQLDIAKQRMSTASTKTIVEYASSSGDILESCITEYRDMARKADEHATAQKKLEDAWP